MSTISEGCAIAKWKEWITKALPFFLHDGKEADLHLSLTFLRNLISLAGEKGGGFMDEWEKQGSPLAIPNPKFAKEASKFASYQVLVNLLPPIRAEVETWIGKYEKALDR